MEIGFELRQAREARGISLAELSRRTKIRGELLRIIENDELDRLPGGIFGRGLLRAYAREVGVDPEAVAQAYAATIQQQATAREVEAPPVAEPSMGSIGNNHEGLRASAIVAAFALVAVAIVAVNRRPAAGPPLAVSAPPAVSQTSVPAATTGAVREVQPASSRTPATPLRIEIQATGPCWIEATADGRRVLYRLMTAGQREVIEAKADVMMRLGDPAALSLSINGLPARPVGAAGRPVWVRITPERVDELTIR